MAIKNPNISVIIPFYNRKKHVNDCLKSVRASTLRDIEIICVDDGSEDDTPDRLERVAARDRRMIVIRAPHCGPYEARWRGLWCARGEFVHFMDSDDTIDPSAYEESYRIMKENGLDYLVFLCTPFTSEKHSQKEEETNKSFEKHYSLTDACCDKVMYGPDLMKTLYSEKCLYVGLPMRIMRRQLMTADDLSMCSAFYHADNFYSVHWLNKSLRAMAVNRRWYNRRVHRDSITMTPGVEGIHAKSILQVIMAFCHSSAQGFSLGEMEMGYLMRLVRGLGKRCPRVPLADMEKMVYEMDEFDSPQSKYLVKTCFLPLLYKASKIL